jgi:hypothetical protein
MAAVSATDPANVAAALSVVEVAVVSARLLAKVASTTSDVEVAADSETLSVKAVIPPQPLAPQAPSPHA